MAVYCFRCATSLDHENEYHNSYNNQDPEFFPFSMVCVVDTPITSFSCYSEIMAGVSLASMWQWEHNFL